MNTYVYWIDWLLLRLIINLVIRSCSQVFQTFNNQEIIIWYCFYCLIEWKLWLNCLFLGWCRCTTKASSCGVFEMKLILCLFYRTGAKAKDNAQVLKFSSDESNGIKM